MANALNNELNDSRTEATQEERNEDWMVLIDENIDDDVQHRGTPEPELTEEPQWCTHTNATLTHVLRKSGVAQQHVSW